MLGLGFFLKKSFCYCEKINCIYVNITDDLTYCLSCVVQLKLSVGTPFMPCISINIVVIKIQILLFTPTQIILFLTF